MKNFKLIIFSSAATAIAVLACNKETAYNTAATNISSITQSASLVTSICDQFAYPDTIFYPVQSSADYIVKPVKPLAGTYGAFPIGLKINKLNGNINITKSETGLDYLVWFVASGASDTCKKFITISGVNYKDSIYVLANNPDTAAPVYNANPLLRTNCSGGCEFDDGADDDNGNGALDEPPTGQELIPQGIVINKATGVINLKKSLQNGALGKNPLPGTYKDFILNYRIGDKSAKALNKIAFRLYYYQNQSQIPAKLKEEMAEKQGLVITEKDENEDEDDNGGGHGSGKGSSSINFTANASATGKQGAGEVRCRPPYIIVTQQ